MKNYKNYLIQLYFVLTFFIVGVSIILQLQHEDNSISKNIDNIFITNRSNIALILPTLLNLIYGVYYYVINRKFAIICLILASCFALLQLGGIISVVNNTR